jgi:hypothetical protein
MTENPQQPATPDEVATTNPLEGLDVTVVMPTIDVRMVDASGLDEYQHSFGWASVYAATAVGFGVPAIQSFQTNVNATLIAVALVSAGFSVRSGLRAKLLKEKIEARSVTYKMRLKRGEG